MVYRAGVANPPWPSCLVRRCAMAMAGCGALAVRSRLHAGAAQETRQAVAVACQQRLEMEPHPRSPRPLPEAAGPTKFLTKQRLQGKGPRCRWPGPPAQKRSSFCSRSSPSPVDSLQDAGMAIAHNPCGLIRSGSIVSDTPMSASEYSSGWVVPCRRNVAAPGSRPLLSIVLLPGVPANVADMTRSARSCSVAFSQGRRRLLERSQP
jgi:hypothetical protein